MVPFRSLFKVWITLSILVGRTTAPRIDRSQELEKVLPETAEFQLTKNAYEALIHKKGVIVIRFSYHTSWTLSATLKQTIIVFSVVQATNNSSLRTALTRTITFFELAIDTAGFIPFTPIRSLGRQSERL